MTQQKNPATISRRTFLEKTTLVAAGAAAASASRSEAQINDARGKLPEGLRVGHVGLGIRGVELLQGSREIEGIETVVACDLYKGHLVNAGELTGGQIETTGDYRAILDRKDIDAVVVAVPDHQHKRVLLDALDAGKHVYIEKPLTHKLADGKEMVSAVKKSGLKVQVGSQYLSMAATEEARDFLMGGGIGKVVMVDAKIYRQNSQSACYYPIPPDASTDTVNWREFLVGAPSQNWDPKRFFQWRLFWDYSGGLATDLFVHLVSATHYLLGVRGPKSVFAFGDIFLWKDYREVPDQLAAVANYPEEFMLKLTTSACNGHEGPQLTFYGTEGTLEFNGGSYTVYYEPVSESFAYSTKSFPSATRDQIRSKLGLDENMRPLGGAPATAGEPVEFRAQAAEGSTTAHLRNFFDSIRNGTEPVEDIEFGVRAVNVAHMVNLSCTESRMVNRDPKSERIG
jgi:predicted dehydrogenase